VHREILNQRNAGKHFCKIIGKLSPPWIFSQCQPLRLADRNSNRTLASCFPTTLGRTAPSLQPRGVNSVLSGLPCLRKLVENKTSPRNRSEEKSAHRIQSNVQSQVEFLAGRNRIRLNIYGASDALLILAMHSIRIPSAFQSQSRLIRLAAKCHPRAASAPQLEMATSVARSTLDIIASPP